jgi:hypothetical protein
LPDISDSYTDKSPLDLKWEKEYLIMCNMFPLIGKDLHTLRDFALPFVSGHWPARQQRAREGYSSL